MMSTKRGTARAVAATVALAVVVAGTAWRFGMPGSPWSGRDTGVAEAAAVAVVPEQPATIRWVPGQVVEGTMFSVVVEGGVPLAQSATGTFAGAPLHFHARDGALIALAAAPLDSTGPRPLEIDVVHADGSRDSRVVDVAVAAGDYRIERLTVAPQFGRPQPAEIRERMAREAARARAVAEASHATPRLWQPPFVAPRESRITSGFGHGRSFNGQIQSRHTGVDFAGAVGAPIRAPTRGVVAIVDDFYLGGGVIYLDHGAGLITAYLHLSAKDVATGDTVQAGQVIGRVGATGRVTGPHLHWIVRYGGHSVDGLTLLELPLR
jgi:murein DD-endopeptidase MepM/ murein hydrolase activator NlpD